MKNNVLRAVGSGVVVASVLLVTNTAFADTSQAQIGGWGHGMMGGNRPAVVGQVTGVSGSSLSVESKRFNKDENTNGVSSTVYSVDASGATVYKNGSTVTLSDVTVGDFVAVQGTVSGTSVTATEVRDGVGPHGPGMMGKRGPGLGSNGQVPSAMIQANIQGNGQPIIGGTVGAVNGSNLTVNTLNGNINYSVDVSGATVMKRGATSTPADIAVGDRVTVQGSVSGTSVAASSVIDHGILPSNTSSATSGTSGTSANRGRGMMGRFFGAIGGFFQRMFGFF